MLLGKESSANCPPHAQHLLQQCTVLTIQQQSCYLRTCLRHLRCWGQETSWDIDYPISLSKAMKRRILRKVREKYGQVSGLWQTSIAWHDSAGDSWNTGEVAKLITSLRDNCFSASKAYQRCASHQQPTKCISHTRYNGLFKQPSCPSKKMSSKNSPTLSTEQLCFVASTAWCFWEKSSMNCPPHLLQQCTVLTIQQQSCYLRTCLRRLRCWGQETSWDIDYPISLSKAMKRILRNVREK